MKIEIHSLEQFNVHFLTEYGEGKGIWQGTPPAQHDVHDVELEITDVLLWGDNIHTSIASDYAIQITGSSCCFTGKLVAIHRGDGIYVITVAIGNSILLLETIGTPPEVGCFIVFTVHNVFLYDTKI